MQPRPRPPPLSSAPRNAQKVLNRSKSSFDESKLPSCVKSGLSPVEERNRRRRTCRFIQEASRKLSLDLTATGTSMVIFHRFYAVHSFVEHDRFEVAMACLLLAAKTEECSRKLSQVIQEAWRLKNMAVKRSKEKTKNGESGLGGSVRSSSAFELGDGVIENIDKNGYLNEKSEEFARLKEKVLLLERILLHTIGFELSIDHPFKFIFTQIKRMVPLRHVEYITPPTTSSTTEKTKTLNSQLTKSAIDFATDSLHTNLCLQFPPKKIALTCIYMSAQYCKVRPTENRRWLDTLDAEGSFTIEDLTSIAVQIMELIAEKKGCDLAIFDSIRKDLELMKNDCGGRIADLEENGNKVNKRQRV